MPDKFSIQRHDMTSMTIGAQCQPYITTIPTRSALNPIREAGPNQDAALEEEERAIACSCVQAKLLREYEKLSVHAKR
ncbi:MAG: hypothetical protein ACKPKO_53880 [Candidatus Fonsibacter sp.]